MMWCTTRSYNLLCGLAEVSHVHSYTMQLQSLCIKSIYIAQEMLLLCYYYVAQGMESSLDSVTIGTTTIPV